MAAVADARAGLRTALRGEHVIAELVDDDALRGCIHVIGEPVTVFELTCCMMDGTLTFACAHLRGCARVFASLVAFVESYTTEDAPVPLDKSCRGARAALVPASQFQFRHAADAMRLLARRIARHDMSAALDFDVWRACTKHGVLQPYDLDVAGQAALCWLTALQRREYCEPLLVPFVLHTVLPHVLHCLDARAVPCEAATDASGASLDSVLHLYAQLVVCVDLVTDDAALL